MYISIRYMTLYMSISTVGRESWTWHRQSRRQLETTKVTAPRLCPNG